MTILGRTVASVYLAFCGAATLSAAAPPRLVVVIVVDQLRPDYLQRFSADFLAPDTVEHTGGFQLLTAEGAVYLDAAYGHLPTFTCPGHAAILTGALPSVSGIVGNRWYDRESGREVGCVDSLEKGNEGERSPRNLLASTVGDELKLATDGAARVVGLGGKDYAVMTLVGRSADLALWFDRSTGRWATSPHYTARYPLPAWVERLNATAPAAEFRGKVWNPLLGPEAYRHTNPNPPYEGLHPDPYGYGWRFPHPLSGDPASGADEASFHSRLIASPFGNQLMLEAARWAVEHEALGTDDTPDVLAVALSSTDYVGHAFGPSSPEVADTVLRTDRQLAAFFDFLSETVGREHLLVVLTSDHGVQYIPREITSRGGAGGRILAEDIRREVNSDLERRFGPGDWVEAVLDLDVYLNHSLVQAEGLNRAEVEAAAAEAVAAMEGVQQVFTGSQILHGGMPPTDLARRVADSYYPGRSGDLVIAYAPNWFLHEEVITTHGPHHPSNAQVPILLWGGGIPAGRHWRSVDPRDIAPTLSRLLGIGDPSGSSGRPLVEVLP